MQPVYQYNLNTNNAKQVGVAARIQEKGAYKGVFTRAEFVQSQKGTQGIEFSFKAESGQTADYLTVWTVDASGKELYGRKVIDALMTCLSLRTINAKTASIKKYDAEAKQEMQVEATIFPEMMNKPVGLLLVREEYAKRDQSTDWKMTIVGAYEATQLLTPREILEKTGPGQLAKIVAVLQDRPMRNKPRPQQQSGGGHQAGGDHGGGFADMDDDIPF
jgi:hypothetical protein